MRSNNIYVNDGSEYKITQLTTSTSPDLINGTFDWVYEEEFSLRDGYRWSPDGNLIAYWQLDTTGVREFPLVNNMPIHFIPASNPPHQYPRIGRNQRSLPGRGVVAATGGDTRWLNVPGDPRNHYIAFMEWAATISIISSCRR